MRLQLRSSLVKPAKKVIGKQRLTVLVNVSFPAPNSKGSSGFPFFLVQRNHPIFSDCVALVRWDVALRRRPGYAAGQHALGGWRPDGEIGRHCGLKICFVKSFLLSPPSRKVNSGKDLGASKA